MEAAENAALAETDVSTAEKKTHRVTFILPDGENVSVEYDPEVSPYHEHGLKGSFLDIALNCGVPLQHACGGNCACTTCHVIVQQGEENLSDMEDDEEDRLYLADGLTLHSRLGCQAVVKGDVTVKIPD